MRGNSFIAVPPIQERQQFAPMDKRASTMLHHSHNPETHVRELMERVRVV